MFDYKKYEKKLYARIKNFLRRTAWLQSESKTEALKRAKVYVEKLKKDGTPAKKPLWTGYICEECGCFISKKDKVDVHHINPVGKFKDWDTYINRLLFVKPEDLLVLCVDCHKKIHEKT